MLASYSVFFEIINEISVYYPDIITYLLRNYTWNLSLISWHHMCLPRNYKWNLCLNIHTSYSFCFITVVEKATIIRTEILQFLQMFCMELNISCLLKCSFLLKMEYVIIKAQCVIERKQSIELTSGSSGVFLNESLH